MRTLWTTKRFLGFLAALLFCLTFGQSFAQINATKEPLSASEKEIVGVFKNISPFVVRVYNVQALTSDVDNLQVRRSAGSGFIWNQDGYIITNYHVVRGANKIIIIFKGKNYSASMVGAEFSRDVAVLKFENPSQIESLLPRSQIPVADSSKLEVGQTAIAIGNPFGLSSTLTKGVISALNRKVPGLNNVMMPNMIQTDASINPGNSGGPLLDSHGNLIGMNTLIVSSSGSSMGLGFAVPSNDVERIVNKIISFAKVFLKGLGVQPLSDRVSAQLKINGIIVAKVFPNSPADKGGLRGISKNEQGQLVLGDVIKGVDNKDVHNMSELYNALEHKKAGDKVIINILRANKPSDVELQWPEISAK